MKGIKMVLNRTHTLASTRGHVINFRRGVPTYVPPEMYREAVAIGASAADGSTTEALVEEITVERVPTGPDRAILVKAAIEQILEANIRDDFTAAGSPSIKAVAGVVGFKVNAKEITAALDEINAEKAQAIDEVKAEQASIIAEANGAK